MIEKRRFHRVRFTAKSVLKHHDLAYQGQLENISLNGALVSFSNGIIVPQGDKCILTVWLKGEEIPLRFFVEVIHSSFTMVGVRLFSVDADTRVRLHNLMERITPEPEKLEKELQLLEEVERS